MRNWLLVKAGYRWYVQQAGYMAAAVAYYAPLAVIPLAYIVVTVSGIFFEGVYIESWLLEKGSGLGPELTNLIRDGVVVFRDTTAKQTLPVLSVLFLSAVVIMAFNTLISGIQQICEVSYYGITDWIEKSIRSVMFLGVLSAYVSALLLTEQIMRSWDSVPVAGISWVVFWLATVVLCTTAYTVLTRYRLSFAARWRGGLIASGLLLLGQSLISGYAVSASVPGLFAAAQLVVILLLWVYAIVSILLYGVAVAYEYDVQ